MTAKNPTEAFGEQVCGPKMLLVAVIAQAAEDLLALRRAGLVDGLTPNGKSSEKYDESFIVGTCEFFGESLEKLLDVGDFSISASTIRSGLIKCSNESKLFQMNMLRAAKADSKVEQVNNKEIRKKLHKKLYGVDDASEYGLGWTIKSSYKYKKPNESP
jgi:hypothetical protein